MHMIIRVCFGKVPREMKTCSMVSSSWCARCERNFMNMTDNETAVKTSHEDAQHEIEHFVSLL